MIEEAKLEGDEQMLPDDTKRDEFRGPFDAAQAADYLWKNGKVPEWIDIAVQYCDKDFSYLELVCSDRYSGDEKRIVMKKTQAPFWSVFQVLCRKKLPLEIQEAAPQGA